MDCEPVAAEPEGPEGRSVVLGIGRMGSGAYTACWLAGRGRSVLLVDSQPLSVFNPELLRAAVACGCSILGGGNPMWIMEGAAELFPAPSVPPSHPFVRFARERGIPVRLDLDLILDRASGPSVLVTGTNGKTTTASWLHLMFQKGPGGVIAGNIGVPAGKVLLALGRVGLPLVLEVSSFQGRYLRESKPPFDCLVVTNFTPNHLDHHESLEEYREAKKGLVPLAKTRVVLNSDDPEVSSWASGAAGEVLFFGFRRRSPGGVFVEGDSVVWMPPGGGRTVLLKTSEITLPGKHNLYDFMAAACSALAAGVPEEAVRAAASDFKGVRFRLQPVGRCGAVEFYDDSAGTCPESTLAALESFPSGAVLIVGGRNKGFDLEHFARGLSRAPFVVLIGETAPELHGLLENSETAASLEDAVRSAFREAVRLGGLPVVFSPGFASFDMFPDYRRRGEAFDECVRLLVRAGPAAVE